MTKNVLPVYLQYKTVELQVRTLQMYYIIHFSTFWCIYISIVSFQPLIKKGIIHHRKSHGFCIGGKWSNLGGFK